LKAPSVRLQPREPDRTAPNVAAQQEDLGVLYQTIGDGRRNGVPWTGPSTPCPTLMPRVTARGAPTGTSNRTPLTSATYLATDSVAWFVLKIHCKIAINASTGPEKSAPP
jgi:hypothetical protein